MKYAKQCIGIEKDERFFPALQMIEQASDNRFKLIPGDILEIKEEDALKYFKIKNRTWEEESRVSFCGNLPFGIATPLFIKWLTQISTKTGAFGQYGRIDMCLMFQKEVGDRLLAEVGKPEYSRISVVCQNFCTVKKLAIIKGKTFIPPPKVDGSKLIILNI